MTRSDCLERLASIEPPGDYREARRIMLEVCGEASIRVYREWRRLRSRPRRVHRETPHHVTVASALLWALADAGHPNPVEAVYEAVEGLVSRALAGGGGGEARLLFLPVTDSNWREALRLALTLAEALGLDADAVRAKLCMETGSLSARAARECASSPTSSRSRRRRPATL